MSLQAKPHKCCTLSIDDENEYVLQSLKERLSTVIASSDDLLNGAVNTDWHKQLQLVKSYPEGTIGISFSNNIGEGCSGVTLGGVLRTKNGSIIASGSNGVLTISTPYFTIHLEMKYGKDDIKTSIDPSKCYTIRFEVEYGKDDPKTFIDPSQYYKIWLYLVELTFDFTEENFGCHEHNW